MKKKVPKTILIGALLKKNTTFIKILLSDRFVLQTINVC